jgi:Ser/Thr protein kinase RdoA (MazF antagonist)
VRAWVERELGAAVAAWRRLPGATTSAVHRLRLADGRSVVLRRYVWRWVLEDEPEVSQREVDALEFAAAQGLAVPEVLAADVDGSAVGDGVPALLMSLVPGRVVPLPDLRAFAGVAAGIHAVDAGSFPHTYGPWYVGTVDRAPAGASEPALWVRAIEIWRSGVPAHRRGLAHRDFHPGNVLWRRGRAHVVDWTSACAGPWGCDIAHARDNLIRLSGFEAADDFLSAYLDLTGEAYDPFWEIASVLEHSVESFTPERVAASEQRLRPAVAAYG